MTGPLTIKNLIAILKHSAEEIGDDAIVEVRNRAGDLDYAGETFSIPSVPGITKKRTTQAVFRIETY